MKTAVIPEREKKTVEWGSCKHDIPVLLKLLDGPGTVAELAGELELPRRWVAVSIWRLKGNQRYIEIEKKIKDHATGRFVNLYRLTEIGRVVARHRRRTEQIP